MDPALLALLTDTVTHAAYVSHDSYGTPTYATPVQRAARVEYKVRRITNAQGQERVSMCKIFLEGTVAVDLRDKVTLSDGTSPAIQTVATPKDEDGTIHHVEVWI